MLTSKTTLSGTLGCAGLEALWEQAGGSHAEAFTAAEIAMAESGGRQYALSPTNDYGYWQINGVHGRDWDPWTTYTSGAYAGRC